MKRIAAIILAFSLLLLCSCGAKPEKPNDLVPDDEKPEPPVIVKSSEDKLRDFCVELYKSCADNGNSMISPVSVMLALGMLQNGAGGNTLAEMEAMFGISRDEANDFLLAYAKSLEGTDDCKISTANSIWLRNEENRLTVNEDFLKTCAKYYDASVFSEPFDKSTCDKINKWIEDETFGLIKGMLDNIPGDAVMYLVNAIGFDAKWKEPYYEFNVTDGKFTAADGSSVDAKYMFSVENRYISGDGAVGFIKPYMGGKYAYAALLPDEGTSASDYLKTLTGDKLKTMFTDAENTLVWTKLPKYKSEYSVEMNDVLSKLGMKDAFDSSKADFTPMAHSERGNIFVSRVLHKSYIEVAETGTKAGAATVIEMADRADPMQEEPKEVYLTRPFVYVIFDTESCMPIFIGCENNVAE